MRRLGYKAGVLSGRVKGPETVNPAGTGVEIMSINLLLDDPEAPVVWRGPVIAGAVFWQER